MEMINHYLNLAVDTANLYLWKYILTYLLLGTGLYFTLRLKLIQLRSFKHIWQLITTSRKTHDNQISSFQAFCTSLGARVGAGNIAGVGVAIYLGGPGAVFWMWVVAILGMATGFVEGVLAQLYKVKNYNGKYIGGPAYYIQYGLKSRFWAVCFAVSLIISFGFIFNAVQANTITAAIYGAFGLDHLTSGLVLSVATAVVIMGGIVRVSKFSEYAVPFMAFIYLILGIIVISMNLDKVPGVFSLIFSSAFGLQTAASGLVGFTLASAIENGVKRGLFSNEAGLGSAANAAATASPLPKHPVSQGYIQMFGVFIDTVVICTISALIILLSGQFTPGNQVMGVALAQVSLASQIGNAAHGIIALMVVMFCFTTIVSSYSYAESNVMYITKSKVVLFIIRCLVVAVVMFGSLSQIALVWNMADVAMAIMGLINLVALLLLSKVAFKVIKDYQDKLRAGEVTEYKNSEFEAWK